jgi:uncharacterized protein (TIGR02598 family)
MKSETPVPNCSRTEKKGFSLVEVSMSLGIVSFALITLLALIPTGLQSNEEASGRTGAALVASMVQADLHQVPTRAELEADPSLPATSPLYGIDLSRPSTTLFMDRLGQPGSVTTSIGQESRFRIRVEVSPLSGRSALSGSVTISWPAAAATPAYSLTIPFAANRN